MNSIAIALCIVLCFIVIFTSLMFDAPHVCLNFFKSFEIYLLHLRLTLVYSSPAWAVAFPGDNQNSSVYLLTAWPNCVLYIGLLLWNKLRYSVRTVLVSLAYVCVCVFLSASSPLISGLNFFEKCGIVRSACCWCSRSTKPSSRQEASPSSSQPSMWQCVCVCVCVCVFVLWTILTGCIHLR